jgi:hypothetical protein
VIEGVMGGSPQGASDHYAEGNPIALLPVEADERLIASVVLDPAQAEAFRRAAEAKGQAVSITVLKDAGHFDMMSPGREAGVQVEEVVLGALGMHRQDR